MLRLVLILGVALSQAYGRLTLPVISPHSPDFRFTSSAGLFPSIFNLAEHATIQANATCGENRQEVRGWAVDDTDGSVVKEVIP